MVNRMKARTTSGVLFRVRTHPHGLGRWHVTVQRLHGVGKPIVRSEMVDSLLPPLARMRDLAAEVTADRPGPTVTTVDLPRIEHPERLSA